MPCIHGNYPSRCRTSPCKGSIYCWIKEHDHVGKKKELCKGCKGTAFCWNDEHKHVGKRKDYCKGCRGSALCWIPEHKNLGLVKFLCKGCKGSALCWIPEHKNLGKRKQQCHGCKGSALCWDESHNNLGGQKIYCKGCEGSGLCWNREHKNLGKQKSFCKGCKGTGLCWIPEHKNLGLVKSICKGCAGSQLCKKHLKQFCKECHPIKYLIQMVRTHIKYALTNKSKHSLEYLGCTGEFYHSYLEEQFQDGMTWENHGAGHGNWNIDHIIPLMYLNERGEPPSQEEIESRLHYTNTQPLWYEDNMAKGNRFIG